MIDQSGAALAATDAKRVENFVSKVFLERHCLKVEAMRFIPMRQMEQPIFSPQYEIGKGHLRQT